MVSEKPYASSGSAFTGFACVIITRDFTGLSSNAVTLYFALVYSPLTISPTSNNSFNSPTIRTPVELLLK